MGFQEIKDGVGFIPGAVNTGVIKTGGGGAILIDSGLEKRRAKKIMNDLRREGFYPLALINTHGHADHCGGNNYLQQKTGLKVYASAREAVFIENPWLEPFYLYSGAAPLPELENKFLQAKESRVDRTVEVNEIKEVEIEGVELEFVALTGHSPGHIGVHCRGIIFSGDSFFSERVVNKHPLPFLTDVEEFLESLSYLREEDFEHYLPAHGNHAQNVSSVIERNRTAVENIIDFVLERAENNPTTAQILEQIFHRNSAGVDEVQSYYLNRTALLAFLKHLASNEKIQASAAPEGIRWKT